MRAPRCEKNMEEEEKDKVEGERKGKGMQKRNMYWVPSISQRLPRCSIKVISLASLFLLYQKLNPRKLSNFLRSHKLRSCRTPRSPQFSIWPFRTEFIKVHFYRTCSAFSLHLGWSRSFDISTALSSPHINCSLNPVEDGRPFFEIQQCEGVWIVRLPTRGNRASGFRGWTSRGTQSSHWSIPRRAVPAWSSQPIGSKWLYNYSKY